MQQAEFSRPLHSLRGLAAIVVVLGHSWIPVNRFDPKFPTFAWLFNSQSAVGFFFVLSGLVLTLSIRRSSDGLASYARYVLRRLSRLLPLLGATVLAGSACIVFLSPIMRIPYQEIGPLDFPHFVTALVGYSIRPNPPSWSIYVELVISLLLPLMWMAYNSSYRSWMVAATICASSIALGFQHCWNFYLINFLAGISILSWGKVTRLSSPIWFWLLFSSLALVFYFDRSIFRWVTGLGSLTDNQWINFVDVITVTPIVAAVFYNAERFSLLANKVFVFFGEISYSIYLNHWFVIAVVANLIVWLWPGSTSRSGLFWLLLVSLVVAITIPLSWLTYRFIEKPGMSIGRTLANRIPRAEEVRHA
jgi:peptidoglycan/LPS O-acetylase OafA/YrhL